MAHPMAGVDNVPDLRELIASIRQQADQIQALQRQVAQPPIIPLEAVAALQAPAAEVRVADVGLFEGNRASSREFLMQLEIVFSGQPTRYAADRAKITYALSRMRGPAFAYFYPQLSSANGIPYATYQEFREAFLVAFDDPNRVLEAERAINALRQGRRPASAVISEVRRLSIDLGWGEAALISALYRSLHEEIKDDLSRIDRPDNFNDFATLVTRIDQRLHTRRLERAHNTHSFIPTPSDPAPTPMQIGAVTVAGATESQPRGPLSPEERRRRIDNNLCLYCGNPGHYRSQCPNRRRRSD